MLCLLLPTAETCTPQRKGLRSSALRPKRPEPGKQDGPIIIETWVPEEDLHLWEIRAFAERYKLYTHKHKTDDHILGIYVTQLSFLNIQSSFICILAIYVEMFLFAY